MLKRKYHSWFCISKLKIPQLIVPQFTCHQVLWRAIHEIDITIEELNCHLQYTFFSLGYFLVLCIKDGPVKCEKECNKSGVILISSSDQRTSSFVDSWASRFRFSRKWFWKDHIRQQIANRLVCPMLFFLQASEFSG